MLFYTSIFVAILIATLLTSFIYKTVAHENRAVNTSYNRITITDISRNYQKEKSGFKTCKAIPTQPIQDSGMVHFNLNEMPGDIPVVCDYQDTAWLVREKKLLSMYEAYNANRKAEPEPRTLEMVSRPFRRTVAS